MNAKLQPTILNSRTAYWNFIKAHFVDIIRRTCIVVFAAAVLGLSPKAYCENNETMLSLSNKAKSYIEQFKSLAIAEMMQNGIPASIKLAQGMFESQYGESKLARKANNHFGIKCNTDWQGDTILHDDDAPQECFRKYDSPEASYIDHSNFILNRGRYDRLFALAPNDYIGWAKGLKEAGYATLPDYADRIIRLIEQNRLYEYDQAIATPTPQIAGNNIALPKKEKSGTIHEANNKKMGIGETASFVANARGSLKAKKGKGKADLNTLDEVVANCESCRPAGVQRQSLDGRPAVYPQAEDIAPTLKRNTSKKHNNKHQTAKNNNLEKVDNLTENTFTIQAQKNEPLPIHFSDSYPYPTPKNLLPDYPTNEQTGHISQSATTTEPETEPQSNNALLLVSNKSTKMNAQELAAMFRKETKMLPPQNLHYINSVKSVVYPYEVTPQQIAATYKLAVELVLRYNDLTDENIPLTARMPIFLQPKKDRADDIKQHPVKKGETLWTIAQQYAIQLSALCEINNIVDNNEPIKEGRKLKLK